jgi:hypothetical protein
MLTVLIDYAADWTIRGSNTGRSRRIASFQKNVQTGCGAHPAAYSVNTVFFSRGEAAGASD